MQRIYEQYKGFASYFLMQPIQIEETIKLKKLTTEVSRLIYFNHVNDKFREFHTEITDDEDGIYKEITINLKDASVIISLCQELQDNYFIAKKLIHFINNGFEYYETLVKKELPNYNYREIATKGWKFGVNYELNYTATKICSKDYTEDIPIYSIQELKKTESHYSRCLSKNKINKK